MSETWKPIPGYEGIYEASNIGGVRYLMVRHGLKAERRDVPLIRKLHLARGYYALQLINAAGKRTSHNVHRLVLMAFVGPCPPSHQGCHLNGVRTDNRVENLAWATVKENHSHKRLHGTLAVGERNGYAKLTTGIVSDIRIAARVGVKRADLAAQYGVHPGTISRIIKRERWSHV